MSIEIIRDIIRWGAPGRELVGSFHRAPLTDRAASAWLLCRPIGLEGTRSAAMYRVIADRLARQGHDVLCFDYHGTADAPGEEADQTLAAWVSDAAAAHAWLADHARPGAAIRWFAMGFGAHVAVRATLRVNPPPRHLLLWEPSLDGGSYLAAIQAAHRAELAREFGVPWDRLVAQGRAREPRLPGDVLGFDHGPALASELEALGPLPLASAMRRSVGITCAVPADRRQALDDLADAPLLTVQTVDAPTNWMSSQAMGSAVVPPQVLQLLDACMERETA